MTSWLHGVVRRIVCVYVTCLGLNAAPPPTRLSLSADRSVRGRLSRGADEGKGMRDEEGGVEVQVREEEGLAFQYPERIKSRALDGGSPQSYTGPGDGRMKGEERGGRVEERTGTGKGTGGQHCEPDAFWGFAGRLRHVVRSGGK